MTSPARRRPCATACQMPSTATTSPICSFVRHAAAGAEREGEQPVLVEEPDRREEERSRERDGMEVVDDEPLGRRVEEVDEREGEPGPLTAEVLPREQEDGHRPERHAYGLYHKKQLRARPHPPERGEKRHEGVEVRSEARDLLALQVGHLEEAAVRRRPDRLGEVADVEAARRVRSLLEHGERGHPCRERRDGDPQQGPRARHAASGALEQSPPARAEHVLAGPRLVGLAACGADPIGQGTVGREAADRRCERSRVSRGYEERVEAVREQLARGLGVGGHERRPAGERLEGLVRDHAGGLRRRAEDPECAPRGLDLAGEALVLDPRHPFDIGGPPVEEGLELAAADDAERDLGNERGRREDRLEAVERDQLADEEGVKGRLGLPAGPEQAVLGADEADLHPVRREAELLAEEPAVGLGVGDDDVRPPERATVDAADDARGGRAAAEAPAVVDERVVQGDERIEDDGPPSSHTLRGGQVEVPGVADDERIGILLVLAGAAQAALGLGDTKHLT